MSIKENEDEWGHHAEVPEDEDGECGYSSQELREMGNSYFAQGNFDSALPYYSMALEKLQEEQGLPQNGGTGEEETDLRVTFLCNRAACFYKMEYYEDSKVDAQEAVRISKDKNAKASFRLARAQIALKEFSNAISCLDRALRNLAPSSAPDISNHNKGGNANAESNDIDYQRKELIKLLFVARKKLLLKEKCPNADDLAQVQSIKSEPRQPSIREFEQERELGVGNFSRIVVCRHKITNEKFALKIIEKKKADQLAKRQHPNVYNEIKMEQRILSERLKSTMGGKEGHRRIIKLYHTFQDYTSLYFLMDLHLEGGDLWSTARYRNKMVGTHPSLIKRYLYELLDALEHIHARGIVHRDLKPENVLLSKYGHIILIDFGTAKDLIETDLNGPEFVGTPDFMAPEAVLGTSGEKEIAEAKERNDGGSCHSLDLWALGAVAFHLFTGATPFNSPSPYLAFLKIQRGNLRRPIGISDDDAWDLIKQLMHVDPKKRLGADSFDYVKGGSGKENSITQNGDGYEAIRNHPYFAGTCNVSNGNESSVDSEENMPIPSLRDLCIRACADMVYNDSLNLDIDKEHPPGDGSLHDVLRLNTTDRGSLMHLLDRLGLLKEPRVYRRFFRTKQEARLNKVRISTLDYVGLTQMNDKQFQFPIKDAEEGTEDIDTVINMNPIQFMHICNPLFVKDININCTDEEQRKEWILQLKQSLKLVNRTRPKLVVATGYLDDICLKLLGKVNESISVILNNGSSFFSFWSCGAQGLVLSSRDFIGENNAFEDSQNCEQMKWLREQLEQSRATRHHVFAFVDCDPSLLPQWLLKKLAKGRTLCLFGISTESACETEFKYSPPSQVTKLQVENDSDHDNNEESNTIDNNNNNEDKDDLTISSCESEDENNCHVMKIATRGDNSSRCITLEEYGVWKCEIL